MLTTTTIQEIPTDTETVFAFRILDEVRSEDLHEMAAQMNARFDRHDDVNMLLFFESDGGREAGATFDLEVLKSQARSLDKVSRYAVVGAPDTAATMVERFGAVLPVESKAFDTGQEEAAWAFVGARPANG